MKRPRVVPCGVFHWAVLSSHGTVVVRTRRKARAIADLYKRWDSATGFGREVRPSS